MFARLLMFVFMVFIAHDALAQPAFQPKIPPHIDRLRGEPTPDRIH